MMFGRTTYNHSPSDLKHYCMARNNLLNLREYRGWPHALAFVAKTVWFYTFTRPQPGRLALSAPRRCTPACAATSPATRGSCDDHGESVAVVVVTYNRADLLARMLDGLAALDPAARRGDRRRQRQHRPHRRGARGGDQRPGSQVIRTRGQPRRRRRLPPRRADGVRRRASTGSG